MTNFLRFCDKLEYFLLDIFVATGNKRFLKKGCESVTARKIFFSKTKQLNPKLRR